MSGSPDRQRRLEVSALVWRVVHKGSDFVPNNGADGWEPRPMIRDPFLALDAVKGGLQHRLPSDARNRDE